MRIFSTTRRKLLALALVAGIVLVPALGLHAHAGFGPDRPTFTWANPANYITFNSITDNPNVGDERTFMSAYTPANTNRVDPIDVTDNEEVTVQVYFHNNAASSLNLKATNTRVRMVLPTNSATSLESTAYISADNATPQTVSDTLDLNSSLPFTMSYVPGTARMWTNTVNGAYLPNEQDLFSANGALVGTNGFDGIVPGCSQYSGYITIHVKIHVTPPPPVVNFACSTLNVVAVDRTRFNFTAQATVQNASVTSYGFTAKDSNGNVVDTNTVTTSALSANYAFNQSTSGDYTVSAVVNTDHGSTNPADCTKQITVQKEKPKPVYACTSLAVTTGANRSITATVTAQADYGAVLQSVNYDFGDGNTYLTDKTSASHTYGKDGTYTVSATLTFNLGSTTATARCSKSVTITTPTTPVVLATTATTLPNTGPGEVAKLFVGASALGAAGHYAVAFRRNRR